MQQVRSALFLLGFLASTGVAQAASWQIDPNHSSVIFRVTHLGVSALYGRFNEVAGTVTADNAGELSAISVDVKTASVDTGVTRRDDHLRRADFFNAPQFPLISFRSTNVTSGGTDGSFQLNGNLTLHGVTKPVTLQVRRIGVARDATGVYHLGGEGTLTIKRSDYGMTNMLDSAGDEIQLLLAFESLKS